MKNTPIGILTILMVTALLGFVFTACGSGGKACELTGNDRSFGQCCDQNKQCASSVCHTFGDGTQACTQTCQDDNECPQGSEGQKCNQQDVCRV